MNKHSQIITTIHVQKILIMICVWGYLGLVIELGARMITGTADMMGRGRFDINKSHTHTHNSTPVLKTVGFANVYFLE